MASTNNPKRLPELLLPGPSDDHAQPRPSMTSPISPAEPTSPKNEIVEMNELLLIIRPVQWPTWIKNIVLFQVFAHAALASWCASAFIPAFGQMSMVFDKSVETLTYLVGAYTLMLGFGLLVWNPLADKIGRRPVMLISLLIAIGATCGVAKAPTYATMLVARIAQGFGACAPCSLGATYVKVMYSRKDRGKALGIWVLGITGGPFFGPFISGFIAHHTTYVWVIWLQALLFTALFIVELFFLPESQMAGPCYRSVLGFRDIFLQSPRYASMRLKDPLLASKRRILTPVGSTKQTLLTLRWPAVWVCGLAFSVPYGYICIGLVSMFPTVYGLEYGFNPSIQGLLYLPMLVGVVLGELIAGPFGDWVVRAPHRFPVNRWVARRNVQARDEEKAGKAGEGVRVPEVRLVGALVGVFLSVGGLIWFGVSIQTRVHWANPAVASAVAAFGVQVLTSICYAYVVDSYGKAAKEVATVLNLFRVLSAFIVLFYTHRLNAAVDYGWAFGIQAAISAVFGFGGLGAVLGWGGRWRALRR